MKKTYFLIIMICNQVLLAEQCDDIKDRKSRVLCLASETIKTKESFSSTCYPDGKAKDGKIKYSIGFGMAEGGKNINYCQAEIEKIRKSNIRYKYVPDRILLKKIKINTKQADFLTNETAQIFLNKLIYNFKKDSKKDLFSIFSDHQIKILLDRIYQSGETKFYLGNKDLKIEAKLYKNLIHYAKTGEINCIKLAYAFMEGSNKNQGVMARFQSQLISFTMDMCFYDLKFQEKLTKI